MSEIPIANIVLALLLGAAIGLERQSSWLASNDKLADSGIRTFALIGLLGFVASIFLVNGMPLVFGLIAGGFVLLLVSHYFLASSMTKDFGFTTEIAVVLTFLIGVCLGTGVLPVQVTVAMTVVIIVVLSLKSRSEKFLSAVSRQEFESFLSFAIIGLVILPFLSNTTYTVADFPELRSMLAAMRFDVDRLGQLELVNPQRLWFIVVLITGIDVLGYVVGRIVGPERGLAMTSFMGGLVSSTVTTQSLAQKSREASDPNYLVGAAVLANLAGFFQMFLLIGPLNAEWLIAMLPTLFVMIATATAMAVFFMRRKPETTEGKTETGEHAAPERRIFSIIPALQFALLILTVKIVTSLSLIFLGKAGFVAGSVIASFAGVDAILINLAGMAGTKITFGFALLTFILVNATNLLAKSFYCYLQGTRAFTFRFLAAMLIVIASSFVGFLFL